MAEKTLSKNIDPSTVNNAFEKSRERWKSCMPNEGLTWGEVLPGDEFILKAEQYNVFGSNKRILEIGPGYGRLIESFIQLKLPLGKYIGIDISQNNVDFLKNKFTDERFTFYCGDAETSDYGGTIDGAYSSATLHHFFPTNEKLIANISSRMSNGARLIYDVPEGTKVHFENDGKTYIRWYERDEICKILEGNGLKLVGFDTVQHLGGKKSHPRLLIIAEKP